MFYLKLILVFLIILWMKFVNTERRITDGQTVETEKPYMVYLVKAPTSPVKYDAWLCGGSIVTPLYILTSAACVEDVHYMYAIAGYSRYVRKEDIASNECTKNAKKKVVYSCVPKSYKFAYSQIEKWSVIDIAVVKVESPYDFNAKSPLEGCSYVPQPIDINYEARWQKPGIDTIVFGWGHLLKWRKPQDTKDYNQDELQYAPTLIADKNICKESFAEWPGMENVIEKYMICTISAGNIDSVGEQISTSNPNAEGCGPKKLKDGSFACISPEEINADDAQGTNYQYDGMEYYRRQNNDTKSNNSNELNNNTRKLSGSSIKSFENTRRFGICQNDHGGPLVTWVGAKEILIGVSSVFRITNSSECTGPYLYTSTQCNGAFINCVINGGNENKEKLLGKNICDQPSSERGFDMVSRRISWKKHPDGPAENELEYDIMMRPQIPINEFGDRM